MLRFTIFLLNNCISSSSAHRVNSLYPVADSPDKKIEEKAIVTTNDFATVSLDTVTSPDKVIIKVKLKADRVQKLADATDTKNLAQYAKS